MPAINRIKDNPVSSNIVDIVFKSTTDPNLNISIIDKKNTLCQFERIEFLESIFDLLPNGALTVRDTSDIITFLKIYNVDYLELTFLDNSKSTFTITGTSYLNNAASETEENFVTINFSNEMYKHSQQHSLLQIMNTNKPKVYKTHNFNKDFVYNYLKDSVTNDYQYARAPSLNFNDETLNYILYRPLNPMEYRNESPSDNYLQYMYYLSTMACNLQTTEPRYMFWTEFDNVINFKYLYENLDDDLTAIKKMNERGYYYAVYNGDTPFQLLSNDDQPYKKIYLLTTSPTDQFISKKYFYIRKTPKVLNDTVNIKYPYYELAYQFQDEGQKYDIEIINSEGVENKVPPGADELICKNHWGYYDNLRSVDDTGKVTLISRETGQADQYVNKNFMGSTNHYPYVDNVEMWHNIFDFTPVDPYEFNQAPGETPDTITNIPGQTNLSETSSNLQKVINIRWEVYDQYDGDSDKLNLIRDIETQNFVKYVLCCIQNEEQESFFAVITGYRPEFAPYATNGQSQEPMKYLYSWKKINYNPTVTNGSISPDIRALEEWELSNTEASVSGDYTTWAINLNERFNVSLPFGVNTVYYAPGWYSADLGSSGPLSSLKYRPIGIYGTSTNPSPYTNTNETRHLVRMYKTSMVKILTDAGITDTSILNDYEGKYLYSFSAENVVDGPCG